MSQVIETDDARFDETVVKAAGPYRVVVGERTWGVAVSEQDVRDGAAVVVGDRL